MTDGNHPLVYGHLVTEDESHTLAPAWWTVDRGLSKRDEGSKELHYNINRFVEAKA